MSGVGMVVVAVALAVSVGCSGRRLNTVGETGGGEGGDGNGEERGTAGAPSSQVPPPGAASCGDAEQNGTETDVDCGGGCGPCADGERCATSADCASGNCDGLVCGSCQDGSKNGNETDVDCGGKCKVCLVGQLCESAADCESATCAQKDFVGDVCFPSHCGNGVKDADESDRDCGGACPTCSLGYACRVKADCEYGPCVDGVCIQECGALEQCSADGATCVDGACRFCETKAECANTAPCSVGTCDCKNGYFVCE